MTKVRNTPSPTPKSQPPLQLEVTKDFFQVLQKRHSIRKYKSYDIPDSDLEKILQAARLAPSTNNSQSWRFIVVRDPETIKLLSQPSQQRFIANANAIIVVLGERQSSCCPGNQARWHLQDPMIATEHLVLAATALGYGTCWVAAYESRSVEFIQRIKTELEIPENADIIVLVAIGVPDEHPSSRSRKALEEIAFDGKYGIPWSVTNQEDESRSHASAI
ncbi:MAG: nitroreductase family protein [Promethearchaeota archaeon]